MATGPMGFQEGGSVAVDPAIVKYACWQRCCAGQGDTWGGRSAATNIGAPENEGREGHHRDGRPCCGHVQCTWNRLRAMEEQRLGFLPSALCVCVRFIHGVAYSFSLFILLAI